MRLDALLNALDRADIDEWDFRPLFAETSRRMHELHCALLSLLTDDNVTTEEAARIVVGR